MTVNSAQIFARLLESLHLHEVSSSMNLLQDRPGAEQLIRYLHGKRVISHDQQYDQVKNISWSQLKNPQDASVGAAVFLVGPNGTGAIVTDGKRGRIDNYKLYASTPEGEVDTSVATSGGEAMSWLQARTGKIRELWQTSRSGEMKDLRRQRKERKTQPDQWSDPQTWSKQLLSRFRPLLAKSIAAAINDVKGFAVTQLKNDAYDKVKKKLETARRLQTALDQLEAGGDIMENDAIVNSLRTAVYQAAAHHYPELAGEWDQHRYLSRYFSTSKSEAAAQIYDELKSGNLNVLGTILAFFRRNLLSS